MLVVVGVHRLEDGVDVAVAVGEADLVGFFAVDAGDVIGHEHVWVSDFFVGSSGFEHVDVAFVGEDFDEV